MTPTHAPAEFLATCWTSAGDVVPGRNGPRSPLAIERRVSAVANAGYTGFGIGAGGPVASGARHPTACARCC